MGQPPPKAMEPECMELISALAAGNKAKMMVEIASGGPTPFTVALAVAAKQTGGRVVCVLPPSGRPAIHDNRLSGVVDFVAAGNPSEAIMRGVDFLVVDSAAAPENGGGGGGGEVWEKVEVSPKGCVVVATNGAYGGVEVEVQGCE
ncbi:unnamed protein product [Cuscuta campestris]|uniref:Tryptophan synthase beta chain-like PALP domain-containing protein n=1 Tax=Cuscuta campestris TaxID=132261 RepID=A0A484L0X2_9ASTE|nr:unnamed protein product [Cuscuta campestris]